MKRRAIIKVTVEVLIIAVIVLLIFSPIIVNDLSAKAVANRISKIPMPDNTRIAESFSQAGKLVGSGNGMQYFGAILIESELSLDELSAYYSEHGDLTVKVQETQKIDVLEHGDFSFETDVSGGNFYIVYSWGNGFSPFDILDMRGH